MMSLAADPQRSIFSLPAKPRSSPLALTIGIMLILALLAGGGVAIYRLMPKPAAPPPLKTPVVHPPAVPVPAPGMAPALKSTEGPPAAAPPAPIEPTLTPPLENDNTQWDHVEQTYRTSPPELGILALQQFIQAAPNSTFIPAAQSQIDESLDRLWWMRVKSLCEHRDDLSNQVKNLDSQIATVKANGTVAERIAELQSQRDPIAKELADVQQELNEMKYTDPRTPDLYDEAQLADLRTNRDTTVFDAWKKSTAAYIQRNRGELPW